MEHARKSSTRSGSVTTPDIFELLHAEHQGAASLLRELTGSGQAEDSRQVLFEQLKLDLEVHTNAEDKVFYAVLREAEAEDLREMVREATEEHDEIAVLLEQLVSTPSDGADWLTTLAELKEAVDHHVEEEETRLFDAAREILTAQQAKELARRMAAEERRQKEAAGAGWRVAKS